MSDLHRQRAQVLMQQGRHAQAEPEWRQALSGDPDDGGLHAQLAICLAAQERYVEAATEADTAIGLAPDQSYPHYARAVIAFDRNRLAEAAESAEAALRLDPEDADYHVLAGQVGARQGRWTEALAGAERALALDPEHVHANNLRATALVHLGRKDEAGATLAAALARDPDNADTHANAGFAALHRDDPAQALAHFSEALRLDANNEAARAGLVEALKARHVAYRWMLAYFLWMERLPSNVRWGLLVIPIVLQTTIAGVANANPGLAPLLWTLYGLIFCFAIMTWIAPSLFNLILRFDRLGRHALSPAQQAGANLLAVLLTLVAANAVVAAIGPAHIWAPTKLALLLALPASTVFTCDRGWPRWAMAAITAALAVVTLGWCFVGVVVNLKLVDYEATADQAFRVLPSLSSCFIAMLLSQFVAGALQGVRVKR